MHHFIGQHGDFVAWHVDGGEAGAAQFVNRITRLHCQPWSGNVYPHGHFTRTQALHTQRIVNLGGGGVINRERLHRRQWQFVTNQRRLHRGKASAFGEILQQKAPPMELVGRINRARLLQQMQRRQMRCARSLNHRLVLGRILVGLEKDFVKLFTNRQWTGAPTQLCHPLRDLQSDLLLFFNGGQRQGDDVCRGLAKVAFACTAKIVRRVVQTKQSGRLLLQRGGFAVAGKIVTRQVGKPKFVVWRKLPGQFKLDAVAQGLRGGDKRCWRRFFKPQECVGGLDLDALAAVKLHLQ